MSTPWATTVDHLRDSLDYVRARDTNRPAKQLEQRTAYLYEQLQAASAGEVLLSRNVVLDSLTVVGTPVYFDAAGGTYRPALAALNMTANDYGFPAETAIVRGIVVSKHTATAGDIALVGKIGASFAIDWSAVIEDGNALPGTYYVSAVTGGRLTQSRSTLSVYVGDLDSSGNLVFHPEINGNLRSHVHQRFVLETDVGATTADPGWIPAAQFSALGIPVPVGATYGYNVALNSALKSYFPPSPVDAHWFEYAGRGVHQDAYVLDANGLWWMDATAPDALAGDPNFSAGYTDYFVLWITRANLGTAVVTSVSPSAAAAEIPVKVVDGSGNAATSGDLQLSLAQALLTSPETSEAGTALKTVDGVTGTFGPVVSRVLAGTGIAVEGELGDDLTGWYGRLTMSAGVTGGLDLQPAVVALDNAVEDYYLDVPVVSLPQGRASSMALRINVPTNVLSNRKLRVIADVIGASTTAGISLTTTYKRIRVGVAVPTTFTAVTTAAFSVTPGMVTRVTSGAIDVGPGDTVVFRIAQPLASPPYDLPIARLQATISAS